MFDTALLAPTWITTAIFMTVPLPIPDAKLAIGRDAEKVYGVKLPPITIRDFGIVTI